MGYLVRVRALAAVIVVVFVVAGCRQFVGLGDPGTIDGAGGDDDGPLCFGSGIVRVCFDTTPTGDVLLGTAVNTDTSGLCATNVTSGGDGLCVVDARTIDIPAGAVASSSGSKPLVLVAATTITVEGSVDVSSKHTGNIRAGGADFIDCLVPTTPASGSNGGGAGGSFVGTGGDGGDPSHATAVAGLAEPTVLHGGCAGGNGASGGSSSKGHGGGAVDLIAGDHLEITGQVNASGSGGNSAESAAGGGGGGSGGMIALDAPTISISGIVFANGGGGGQGGSSGDSGQSGGDPANGAPGAGGSGGGGGGDGGDGGAGASTDGTAGSAGIAGSAGAGGGGGSVGVIRIYGERTVTGTISPPAP